jgi:hypothetical protein
MLTESAKTTIDPRALTDYELLRFTEEFADNGNMPQAFQQELVERFAQKITTGIAY